MKLPVLVSLLALVACERERPPPSPEHAALGGQIVARIDDVEIPAPLIRDVARAQRISPAAALDALVADALAAKGARTQRLDVLPSVTRDLTALNARLVADRLRLAAIAEGPPTDAEVNELTQQHWREVDVPEQLHAIHAIAIPDKKEDAVSLERARNVAQDLAIAVRDATSADEFEARAKAVPHPNAEVRVERLPGFVSDGRIVDPQGGMMDEAFTKAAFALVPGETSKVVESPFGFHVIRAIDRVPPKQVPFGERRALFTSEAYAVRSRKAFDRLLPALKKAAAIDIATDAESVMAEVSTPHPPPQ